MKIIINSKQLLERLQHLSSITSTNSALPILECFLFEKENNQLKITASDLDNRMTSVLNLESDSNESFSIAISSKILLETLKALPHQPLTFIIGDNGIVEIISESGKYVLPYFNGTEFPKPKEVEDTTTIQVNSKVLVSAISKTLFATGNDDLRPVMTGVLVQIKEDRINVVSTDAHKLVKYSATGMTNENEADFILPKKPLQTLKSILEKVEDVVSIQYNSLNVIFSFGEYQLTSRLIDGKYPNYEAVIPKENPNVLTIDRTSLLSVVKRVNIFSDKSTHQIKLGIKGSELAISSEDKNTSNKANEKLTCTYQGEDMEIGFNSRFLAEMLSNLPGSEITLEMSVPNKAGIIKPVDGLSENEEVLMLVMPVLLSN